MRNLFTIVAIIAQIGRRRSARRPLWRWVIRRRHQGLRAIGPDRGGGEGRTASHPHRTLSICTILPARAAAAAAAAAASTGRRQLSESPTNAVRWSPAGLSFSVCQLLLLLLLIGGNERWRSSHLRRVAGVNATRSLNCQKSNRGWTIQGPCTSESYNGKIAMLSFFRQQQKVCSLSTVWHSLQSTVLYFVNGKICTFKM